MSEHEHPASFDELIGADILVGLTYVDASGRVVEHTQKYGQIVGADERAGVVLDCDGERFAIPPALDFISRARPGRSHLKSTDRVVIDPDFLASFEISYRS